MNMPVDDDGTVQFTTTLFALIRESLSIKMRSADEMDQADQELRRTLKKLWPLHARKHLTYLAVPENSRNFSFSRYFEFPACKRSVHSELSENKLTVGKIYTALLIVENYRAKKNGRGEQITRATARYWGNDTDGRPPWLLGRLVDAALKGKEKIFGSDQEKSGRSTSVVASKKSESSLFSPVASRRRLPLVVPTEEVLTEKPNAKRSESVPQEPYPALLAISDGQKASFESPSSSPATKSTHEAYDMYAIAKGPAGYPTPLGESHVEFQPFDKKRRADESFKLDGRNSSRSVDLRRTTHSFSQLSPVSGTSKFHFESAEEPLSSSASLAMSPCDSRKFGGPRTYSLERRFVDKPSFDLTGDYFKERRQLVPLTSSRRSGCAAESSYPMSDLYAARPSLLSRNVYVEPKIFERDLMSPISIAQENESCLSSSWSLGDNDAKLDFYGPPPSAIDGGNSNYSRLSPESWCSPYQVSNRPLQSGLRLSQSLQPGEMPKHRYDHADYQPVGSVGVSASKLLPSNFGNSPVAVRTSKADRKAVVRSQPVDVPLSDFEQEDWCLARETYTVARRRAFGIEGISRLQFLKITFSMEKTGERNGLYVLLQHYRSKELSVCRYVPYLHWTLLGGLPTFRAVYAFLASLLYQSHFVSYGSVGCMDGRRMAHVR
ncbi:hypothetical protein D918_03367 [Trichuris suis]|nr:hypothetical protein D918_03367 [Trichuris suis]